MTITRHTLLERMAMNHWKPIQVIIPETGDIITITPCSSTTSQPKSKHDCEWFDMQTTAMNLLGTESIDEVVDKINNFLTLKEEHIQNENRLNKFYNEHIKPYTSDEWKQAYCVYSTVSELANSSKPSLKVFVELNIEKLSKQFKLKKDRLIELVTLGYYLTLYSDWHKDCYGIRPVF